MTSDFTFLDTNSICSHLQIETVAFSQKLAQNEFAASSLSSCPQSTVAQSRGQGPCGTERNELLVGLAAGSLAIVTQGVVSVHGPPVMLATVFDRSQKDLIEHETLTTQSNLWGSTSKDSEPDGKEACTDSSCGSVDPEMSPESTKLHQVSGLLSCTSRTTSA